MSKKHKIKEIQDDLSYRDQELLAKMDFFFWEKEQIKETTEERRNKGFIIDEDEEFYLDRNNKPVFLYEVNRRLLNTVERYRQEKNEDIENLKKNGAVLTGGSEYECYMFKL